MQGDKAGKAFRPHFSANNVQRYDLTTKRHSFSKASPPVCDPVISGRPEMNDGSKGDYNEGHCWLKKLKQEKNMIPHGSREDFIQT
jgi:hypothetical protein